MPRIGGQVVGGAHHGTHEDGGADEISIASLSGTPAALNTHIADLDAHTKSLYELLRTGQYQPLIPFYGTTSTIALSADTMYAHPFLVPRTITFDRIAIEITTEAVGKSARLGIYQDGANLYPGSLALDASTVSINGTGVVAATINKQLTKGLYWAVVLPEADCSIAELGGIFALLGVQATDFSNTSHYTYWSVSQAYGSLPDPFTAGGALNAYTDWLAIILRVASLD